MSAEPGAAFFDSNVLLYLLSSDERKAQATSSLLREGGWISVQVLNEVAHVATRKFGMGWPQVRDFLGHIRALLDVVPITVDIHDAAIELAHHHRLSFYDAAITAAAVKAGCSRLWSEDLQHGRRFATPSGRRLVVRNPFLKS